MLSKLQQQRCIWPEHGSQQPKSVGNVSRWDKVVGLVPQSLCLFKSFSYQVELISAADLETCVENELQHLVSWSDIRSYHWVTKVEDRWQVSVWFWNPEDVSFAQPVTHIIPALVYHLARAQADKGVLLYSESNNDEELSWAISWQDHRLIEQLYPQKSFLHAQSLKRLMAEEGRVCFSSDEKKKGDWSSLAATPKSSVLAKAKCTTQFDIENPWLYWRAMLVGLVTLCVYISLDALLLKYEESKLDTEVVTLQQQTMDLQRLRASFSDTSKILEQGEKARARQQAPALLLSALTEALPKDIVLDRLTYSPQRLVMQGTMKDSAGMLDTLSQLPAVEHARFIGEVVPTQDGRQEFQAELQLKEAVQWIN